MWEYIGVFFGGKVPLCIRFQLGNSFGNIYIVFFWRESSLMYSFSIRQFIWEYIGGLFFWKSSGVQKNQQGSNGRFPY